MLVVSSFYHSLLHLFFLADKFCSTSTSCCCLSTAYEAFRPCKCSHAKKCRTVSATHIGLSVISCLYIFCGLQFSVNWYISEDALKVLLACFRGLPILPIILYNPQLVHKDLSQLRRVQFLATECHKLLLLAQHQWDLGLYIQGLFKDLGLVQCNRQVLLSLHHCNQLWFLLLHRLPCKQSTPQMFLVITKTVGFPLNR